MSKSDEAALETGEEVLATISAFTGILAIPFVTRSGPWWSTRWKLAVTDRRLIATEHPWLSKPRLAPITARFGGIRIRVHWLQAFSANLTVEGDVERRFKVFGSPVKVNEFLKHLRKVVPPERIDG